MISVRARFRNIDPQRSVDFRITGEDMTEIDKECRFIMKSMNHRSGSIYEYTGYTIDLA
jgi:hypothetical protein